MQIEINNLTKHYRKVSALDAVDLTVPTGMFGLLGANGAGKTTLMRIVAGLLRPTRGTVHIGGNDMASAAGRLAVKRQLGYLPQDLGLYPDLTARELLDYLALLKEMDDRRSRRRRIEEVLELVGLTADADRKLKGYSGGMRRRVGIAQALLAGPKLLVVDEPTVGLDPEERLRFRTLLSRFADGRTVLLSTHIVEDIAQTCREVAVLASGQVAFRGTTDQLTQRAHGQVWTVVTGTSEPAPPVGTVVSALQQPDGTTWRVVARTAPNNDAEPAAPTLEDGYLTLGQPA